VYTGPTGGFPDKIVTLYGSATNSPGFSFDLYFPPNDPRFLPELVRAMSHPHLKVSGRLTQPPNFVFVINDLFVHTDYPDSLHPNFDERTITNQVRTYVDNVVRTLPG